MYTMVNSLGSLLLLSLLLEICTLSIIATNSCQGSCDPGQQPSEYCTNPLLCNTCPQGTFSDRNLRFGEKCNTRKTCLEDHMVTIDEGDETHDATCGCKEGYEMSKSVHACYRIPILLTISSESAEELTRELAVNTNTTYQVPVPSTTKTGLVLGIVLPVSILALILIFGLLYVYKNDKFRLKGGLRTICCDRNGLQEENHEKSVGELPEVQPLNADGDPESNGIHEDTLQVRETDYDAEENGSASKAEQAMLQASEQRPNGASSAHLSPSSRSYTESHKENSKVVLQQPALPQQHIWPSQQQPIKANDTEPQPVPPVKSGIHKHLHSATALSTGSLPPSQLTRLEIGSRTSTTPHLPPSKSNNRSDKENFPKISLQQHPLSTQRQPAEANDTEPPPVPPVKSEKHKQSHVVLPLDLDEFFTDNLVAFKKYLNMDSDFLTHLYSNRVISPSMMETYRESRELNTDKVLNLMTNHLPKKKKVPTATLR